MTTEPATGHATDTGPGPGPAAPEPPVEDAPRPPRAAREGSVDDLAYLIDCYRAHGPIFLIDQPGELARKEGASFTVLAGPAANTFTMKAASMHQSDVKLRSDRHWEDFSSELKMEGHTREGEGHRRHRTLTSRGYARSAVTGRIGDMVRYVEEQVLGWRPGERTAVVPAIQRVVSEQLGRLLIGHPAGGYLDDLVIFVRTTKVATLLRTEAAAALSDPAYIRARDRVFELGHKAIQARRAIPADAWPDDLLTDLLTAYALGPDDEPSPMLMAATVGPLLAGLETASYRSAFLLYLLLNDPKAAARVRAEADEWFAGPLTWERLKGADTLRGAMMDALRLYPGPSRQWYTAVQPFVFEGHLVREGDSVIVVYDVSHHLDELFPRAAEFDVDRYAPPRMEHRQPGAYAPFGVGGHTCLGSGIAETQVMVNVATILHHLDLAPDPLGVPFDADGDAESAVHVGVVGRRTHP
ncbi:cytochrome P450 [Actinomadura parmotrematis]|uniref:Cytochrome P450 n=1 Tax=Actinomadura parmotrematis TaxID=2864039 RepID=A0ABS7FXX2_9ACTN|nr:cytochrome P450 [Actinomadura parmotrematis]MBW8484298.1 cytochrome P450 [Actinomadura parmotrematis]